MKHVLIIVFGLHGLLHVVGFLKAFEWIKSTTLKMSISKPLGYLWLSAFVMTSLFVMAYSYKTMYWWLLGFLALALSQVAIVLFWQDAKFGSIINIIILWVSIVGYAQHHFNKTINREVTQLFATSVQITNTNYELQTFDNLPIIIQRWLTQSGAKNADWIQSVYLRQELEMQLDPSDNKWKDATAEQYFFTNTNAFHWSVQLGNNRLLPIVGRDKFEKGKGQMQIKLAALFNVVHTLDNHKIDQATLQRYLAEIVWFPTIAMDSRIRWEAIDNYSARASLTVHQTKGSGIFTFNKNGEFQKFVTMRYKDVNNGSTLLEWSVNANEHKVINGINVPIKLIASWKIDNKDWQWLKVHITDIHYNLSLMPIDKTLYSDE